MALIACHLCMAKCHGQQLARVRQNNMLDSRVTCVHGQYSVCVTQANVCTSQIIVCTWSTLQLLVFVGVV